MQMGNHHYLGHGATFHLHSLGFQTHPTPPSPHPSSGSGQIPKICTTRPEQISCTEQVFAHCNLYNFLFIYVCIPKITRPSLATKCHQKICKTEL
jgi:hypothetical protein